MIKTPYIESSIKFSRGITKDCFRTKQLRRPHTVDTGKERYGGQRTPNLFELEGMDPSGNARRETRL